MTDEITTPETDEIGLTARERLALNLPPARKVERDKDGSLSAAELARRILEQG